MASDEKISTVWNSKNYGIWWINRWYGIVIKILTPSHHTVLRIPIQIAYLQIVHTIGRRNYLLVRCMRPRVSVQPWGDEKCAGLPVALLYPETAYIMVCQLYSSLSVTALRLQCYKNHHNSNFYAHACLSVISEHSNVIVMYVCMYVWVYVTQISQTSCSCTVDCSFHSWLIWKANSLSQ